MFKVVLLATFMFIWVHAFSEYDKCPQMEPMTNFDIKKFKGVWYGVQAEKSIPVCEIFKVIATGEPFSYILSTETRLSTAHNKYQTRHTETLTVSDTDFLSKMSVSPLPRDSGLLSLRVSHVVQSNFTVVNTDYDTFAIVYRCDGYVYYSISENENSEDCSRYASVWSRSPITSESFRRKIKKIIDNHPWESLLYNLNEIKNTTGCMSNSVLA